MSSHRETAVALGKYFGWGDLSEQVEAITTALAQAVADAERSLWREIRSSYVGAHLCPDWDFMFIGKRDPEWSSCNCETARIRARGEG